MMFCFAFLKTLIIIKNIYIEFKDYYYSNKTVKIFTKIDMIKTD